MTALQAALPLLTELRQALGQHGELSGQEAETRRLLREFLARHTSLEVYDLSGGLVAAHRELQGPCIAFRGDMDAIPGPNGPYHGCGHDGHSALLAGLGLLLEGQRLGKSVLLLFQPAEETGQGAAPMAQALLAKERVQAIVGFHNIPGYPLGQPLLRQGGVCLRLPGAAAPLAGQAGPRRLSGGGLQPHPPAGRPPGRPAGPMPPGGAKGAVALYPCRLPGRRM